MYFLSMSMVLGCLVLRPIYIKKKNLHVYVCREREKWLKVPRIYTTVTVISRKYSLGTEVGRGLTGFSIFFFLIKRIINTHCKKKKFQVKKSTYSLKKYVSEQLSTGHSTSTYIKVNFFNDWDAPCILICQRVYFWNFSYVPLFMCQDQTFNHASMIQGYVLIVGLFPLTMILFQCSQLLFFVLSNKNKNTW